MYTEATGCPFPIYAEPTRKLYDHLGMTRTFDLGSKPEYMQTNVLINSVQSIFQGLSTGRKALKGGDFKQVGGEFLFENGECTAHMIHSRPPRVPSSRLWIARSAKVTGEPVTSSSGMAIDSIMCPSMCTLNRVSW